MSRPMNLISKSIDFGHNTFSNAEIKIGSADIFLATNPPYRSQINPHFKSLEKWVTCYIGEATAQFHQLEFTKIPAIRDENRNAILLDYSTQIEGRKYYLSVKGCGAYEDMIFGDTLTVSKLHNACRNPSLKKQLEHLSTAQGFILAENWMGESPYGAQGEQNAIDELEFSQMATPLAIQGAYLCPVIGIVQLPEFIETAARQFYWFRTYRNHFYQTLRLVPSRARLYFESDQVIENPDALFHAFQIENSDQVTLFERNFLQSGIALLSLFTRSARVDKGFVTGLIYQDVWLDKDAIIAPDGILHFADLEGLDRKTVMIQDYVRIQQAEWHKLVFEFLYALISVDTYRRRMEGLELDWTQQRRDLASLVMDSLGNDPIAHPHMEENTLFILLESSGLPQVKIPFLEHVNP
jgi:hypothetical protein